VKSINVTSGIKVNVIDLDGCLSDDRHRRSLAMEGKYDEYNEKCNLDFPCNLEILLPLMQNYIILSSRHESEFHKTLLWLKEHQIPLPIEIHLRPEGNKDSSPVLKKKMLLSLVERGYEIMTAVDDREHVTEMYSAFGIENVFLLKAGVKNRLNPVQVLQKAIKIQEERQKRYGTIYQQIGGIMKGMFPNGVLLDKEEDFVRFCLFHMTVTKLTRYAGAFKKGGDFDSALDLSNYGSFLASLTEENEESNE